MDKELQAIIALAKSRGSKHIKKDISPSELADSMAELGVFLLTEYDRVKKLKENAKSVEELNDLQKRIDHFRRVIFATKRKMFR